MVFKKEKKDNIRSNGIVTCSPLFFRFPLYVSGTKDVAFHIPLESKKKAVFRYKVRLPPYITCTQCVIQWTYYTGKHSGGNNFPACANSATRWMRYAGIVMHLNNHHLHVMVLSSRKHVGGMHQWYGRTRMWSSRNFPKLCWRYDSDEHSRTSANFYWSTR